MDSSPYIIFTIHIPMEWLVIDMSYDDILNHLMDVAENYFNIHGSYDGLTLNIAGIQAVLSINIITRILWFRRIPNEDDPRPPTIHYYPSLAPPALEEEWQWGGNNDIDDIDDNLININDIVDDNNDNDIVDYNDNDDDVVFIGEFIRIDDDDVI
ncbi:hypothetical protein PV325_012410 [Microctonus aethiopoides]|nr:hypothetical protein PV325_012410 [Microctonus aethiopoides]